MKKEIIRIEKIAKWLGVIMVTLFAAIMQQAGAAPETQKGFPPLSAENQKKLAAMKTPTNAAELVENLRDALRSHLLFDLGFYTEKNIEKLTSSKTIEMSGIHGYLVARITDFKAIADDPGKDGQDGWSIEIALDPRPAASDPKAKKAVAVMGEIAVGEFRLPYSTVEKLVGHPWVGDFSTGQCDRRCTEPAKTGDAKSPDCGGLQAEPADTRCKTEKIYLHQDGDMEEKGRFIFDPKGGLERFSMGLEEK